MNTQNFSTAFAVDQTPAEVFKAVTDVRRWWSEELEGDSCLLGDEFTYRYGDLHRSTQRLIEVVPERRVVWLVVDGHLSFVERKSEWTGTKVVFDISRRNGRTELAVTHQGLNPECECFDACSRGWGFYINQSLRRLITTGAGQPDRKEPAEG
jgi:hypothetical protein